MTSPPVDPPTQAPTEAAVPASDPTETPAPSRARRTFVSLIQIAISGGLLYWIFSDLSGNGTMTRLLSGANPIWIAVAVASAGVAVVAGIVRWRIFLEMLALHLSWRRVTAIYLIGGFFDLFLLGATGGDAAKAVCVMREYPHRKTTAFMSLAMDHMSGLGALLAATAIFTVSRADLLLTNPVTATMFWFVIGYVTLAFVGIALCILVSKFPIPPWAPIPASLGKVADDMHAAFTEMRSQWRASLSAVAVSFVALFAYYFTFFAAARALAVSISLPSFLSAMPVVEALISLPISVAGLGVREKTFEYLLEALADIPMESAVLVSLGGFACWSVWNFLGGVVFALYRRSESKP